jgi:plasmid maintenance system antidote protein VapI
MNRISAIVNRKRSISVDTAMRLARYFGTPPQSWLNLQTAHDLGMIDRLVIEREVLPRGTPPGIRVRRAAGHRVAR